MLDKNISTIGRQADNRFDLLDTSVDLKRSDDTKFEVP